MRGGEPGTDQWGDGHPNAWAQAASDPRAGDAAGEQDGSATWAEPDLTGWLSPAPGVFRRAAAPEGLGAIGGVARVAPPQGDAPSSGRRARGGLWRVVGVGVVAVVVILGLARVAGTGPGAGAVPVGWESSGAEPSAVVSSGVEPSSDSRPMAQSRPSSPAAPSPSGATGSVAAPVPATPTAPSAHPGEPDWWSVLAELDRRRAMALAATDPALLGEYAQLGSPAWESDEALVSDLSARGLQPEGLTTHVLAIERVDRDGAEVAIWAVDRRSGYTLLDDAGEMVQAVEPGLPSRWAITLAQVAPDGATPDEAGADAAGPDEPDRTAGAGGDPADRGERPVAHGSDPGWRVVRVVPGE